MKYLIVWFFIAMCISDIKAQEKEFIRDNFPGMGSRFNKALHAYLLGNSLFNEGENSYYLAKIAYLEAYSFNPNHALLNFNIGICYLKTADKLKAKTFFNNAFLLNFRINPKINYYFGVCFQLESQWDSAMNYYKIYEANLDKLAQREEWILTEKR